MTVAMLGEGFGGNAEGIECRLRETTMDCGNEAKFAAPTSMPHILLILGPIPTTPTSQLPFFFTNPGPKSSPTNKNQNPKQY